MKSNSMIESTARSNRKRKPKAKAKERALSRVRAPEDLSLEDWQIGLRRQFGSEQNFICENLGNEPVFSEFRVSNPGSGGRYRVSIRGVAPGSNRCDCGDYATNELGTCKHIEFVLAHLSRKRGGKAELRRGFAPAHSELWLQFGAQHRICLRPGSAMPPSLRKAAESLFEVAAGWCLPESRLDRLEGFMAAARQASHPVQIAEDVPRFVSALRAGTERRMRLEALFPLGANDPALRDLLSVPLFPYQAQGTWFAAAAGRALIADDMGLGKTIQAIAAAELWQRHFGAERVLVVCPTSLKVQWAHELARFAGREALVIEGNAVERARLYAAPARCKIASYDSLTRDLQYANAWRPEVLIVDEAQRIKNWNTQAARALKRLDSHFALVLTGTPLENRLEELLSVVQLVDRHRLGPTWRFLHAHQLRDEVGRVTGYRDLDRIAQTLAPILIRRHKREVLTQLPPRSDEYLRVALTPLQRRLHDDHVDQVARIVARWRKQHFLSDADQKRMHAALQSMRMVCNSSYLLNPDSNEGNKIPELLAWLEPRLADVEAKAVIFSAWLGTLELLAEELKARQIEYVEFNGSVPAPERAKRVERFLTDPQCRVFLATDAGGVGLNLQHAASIIINVDLPWNPAVLEQRIGRVYRLGQQRRVEVLNMVASDSIEERMLGVLKFKRSLFEGALDGGAADVHFEGTQLSRFMASVESLTSADGDMETPAPSEPAAIIAGSDPAPETAVQPEPDAPAYPAVVAETSAPAAADLSAALQPLLHIAGAWLTQIAAAATAAPGQSQSHPLVERDPVTGQSSLRLPLPEPALLRQLADMLDAVSENRSRGG
jgi:superfamily II DNA or RNA helicase